MFAGSVLRWGKSCRNADDQSASLVRAAFRKEQSMVVSIVVDMQSRILEVPWYDVMARKESVVHAVHAWRMLCLVLDDKHSDWSRLLG